MAESRRATAERPTPHDTDEPEGWGPRWPPLVYWVKVTLIVVLTLAVLAGARSVANILILVVIAMVLAVGFDPLVERLVARGLSRPAAVSILVASLIAIGVAFGLLIVPPLVSQASIWPTTSRPTPRAWRSAMTRSGRSFAGTTSFRRSRISSSICRSGPVDRSVR